MPVIENEKIASFDTRIGRQYRYEYIGMAFGRCSSGTICVVKNGVLVR